MVTWHSYTHTSKKYLYSVTLQLYYIFSVREVCQPQCFNQILTRDYHPHVYDNRYSCAVQLVTVTYDTSTIRSPCPGSASLTELSDVSFVYHLQLKSCNWFSKIRFSTPLSAILMIVVISQLLMEEESCILGNSNDDPKSLANFSHATGKFRKKVS